MTEQTESKVVEMPAKEPIPLEAPKKATFSPTTNYQWSPMEIFPLKGGELHALKQILTALTQPAEAQRAIAAYEALKLIDNIIKEGVENNLIHPTPQEQEPKNMQ